MSARVRSLGLAGLALLAAAALALLAGAVFSVERDLGALTSTPSERSLRGRIVESLLGVGDDRSLRETVRLIEAAGATGTSAESVLAQHGEALARLTRLADEGDSDQQSYVVTLVGVLYAEDAELAPDNARRYRRLAIEAFQRAALLDPRNEDAKYDLEVLLSRVAGRRAGFSGEAGFGSESGAGSRPAGSGY